MKCPVCTTVNLVMAFPDIPGIDTGQVSATFGSDREFFLEMLALFSTRFGDAAEQVRADLAVGNRDAAARHLHALRGTAGNLGALELMSSAWELEQAVAAGRTDTGLLLERVAGQLAVMREAAASWLPERRAVEGASWGAYHKR